MSQKGRVSALGSGSQPIAHGSQLPMFLAHSIRLRDPWQCEPADDGGLRWSRVFHCPTGLESDDQLVLVITGLPLSAQVTINGHPFAPMSASGEPSPPCATGILPVPDAGTSPPLPTGGCRTAQPPPAQFDVTPILIDDNRIEILVSPPTPSPQPPAPAPAPAPFPYDARLAIIGHS